MKRLAATRGASRPALNARQSVKTYVSHSLSASTRRAYASDLLRFKAWGGLVPATPRTVARYLAAHASTLKPSTLTRHLAALAHAHSRRNLTSPTSSPLVRSTLRGIRRMHGCSQKQARPLTLRILRLISKSNPAFSALQNARDRALLLIGYAGGFRRSELASMRLQDVKFTVSGWPSHLEMRGRDVDDAVHLT